MTFERQGAVAASIAVKAGVIERVVRVGRGPSIRYRSWSGLRIHHRRLGGGRFAEDVRHEPARVPRDQPVSHGTRPWIFGRRRPGFVGGNENVSFAVRLDSSGASDTKLTFTRKTNVHSATGAPVLLTPTFHKQGLAQGEGACRRRTSSFVLLISFARCGIHRLHWIVKC